MPLEYASSVWDAYLTQNIDAIERVQKFALKVCLKDWHSDYDNLLNRANVPPLAARRKVLKLCQLFTILKGHSHFPDFPTAKRASPYPGQQTQPLCLNSLPTLIYFKNPSSHLQLNYGTHYLQTYVTFSHCHILSRLYLLFVVLTVIYLFNSNPVLPVFLSVFCSSCITSLMLDIRLVLAYLQLLMSRHNKFIM